MRQRRPPVLVVVLCAVALVTAAKAGAVIVEEHGVRIEFQAGFTPHALPRSTPKPVTLHLSVALTSTDGVRPPRLRLVSFAVNRHGRLFTRGLPVCPAAALQATTTQGALDRCRSAEVGSGSFSAVLPASGGGSPIPVHGRAIAFNGRRSGGPVILLHFFVSAPIQEALVIPLEVRRNAGPGELSTLLSASIPLLAGGEGYVTGLRLTIGRRFSYRGRRESLLSASCPAPAGFNSALFALARGTFEFAGGRHLTTTLTGHCRVA